VRAGNRAYLSRHGRRPPALLLGGLNLVRALGLAGIPVVLAATRADSLAFASRFCSQGVLLPPLEPLEAAVDRIVRLGERLSRAVGASVPLFYGDDDYLNLVLRNRGRLAQHFRFIVNDREVAMALIDKERFAAFGRARGLPLPRQLDWDEAAACDAPVLVKPKVKLGYEQTAVYLRLCGREAKARIYPSGRALLADPLAHELRDALVLQEYVPGSDRDIWTFHGYADEGSRVIAWFIGRKIRTHPEHTGKSSYLELARHEALAALGHRIVAQATLKGAFKMDFKRDPASGRFYLLEINARFNLWHYLGAANGISLPRAAYDYLVEGRRPAPPPFRTAVRWLSFRRDWRAYRRRPARGELGFWRWAASLAFSRSVHEVFAWRDPLPYLVHCNRRLRRWLSTAS
jgi:predicted ATP-grasp superfamily ATP-dependent carboligase